MVGWVTIIEEGSSWLLDLVWNLGESWLAPVDSIYHLQFDVIFPFHGWQKNKRVVLQIHSWRPCWLAVTLSPYLLQNKHQHPALIKSSCQEHAQHWWQCFLQGIKQVSWTDWFTAARHSPLNRQGVQVCLDDIYSPGCKWQLASKPSHDDTTDVEKRLKLMLDSQDPEVVFDLRINNFLYREVW
jgi:hypothetical protein